ncbi:MAG: hypothetical protein ACLPN5_11910 [Roseiarcus sp.]
MAWRGFARSQVGQDGREVRHAAARLFDIGFDSLRPRHTPLQRPQGEVQLI